MLKREAHRAQALGEQLIALGDAELTALALPEALHDAIVAARSISSRGGGARQRQYIGKLMRDIDLTRVREILGAKAASSALEAQRFQRVENWRTRLHRRRPRGPERAARGLSGAGCRAPGRRASRRPRRSTSAPARVGPPPGSCSAPCANCWDRHFGYNVRLRTAGASPVSVWVGIIMGSSSDWETMRPASEILDALSVPHEVRVVSAHRTPDLLFEYAASARAAAASRPSSPAPAARRTCRA